MIEKQDLSGDTYMYVHDVSRNKISTRAWSGSEQLFGLGLRFLLSVTPGTNYPMPGNEQPGNPITRVCVSVHRDNMHRKGEIDILPDLVDAPKASEDHGFGKIGIRCVGR